MHFTLLAEKHFRLGHLPKSLSFVLEMTYPEGDFETVSRSYQALIDHVILKKMWEDVVANTSFCYVKNAGIFSYVLTDTSSRINDNPKRRFEFKGLNPVLGLELSLWEVKSVRTLDLEQVIKYLESLPTEDSNNA